MIAIDDYGSVLTGHLQTVSLGSSQLTLQGQPLAAISVTADRVRLQPDSMTTTGFLNVRQPLITIGTTGGGAIRFAHDDTYAAIALKDGFWFEDDLALCPIKVQRVQLQGTDNSNNVTGTFGILSLHGGLGFSHNDEPFFLVAPGEGTVPPPDLIHIARPTRFLDTAAFASMGVGPWRIVTTDTSFTFQVRREDGVWISKDTVSV